eukprot:TRINITY_DN21794_c0_g1_i1.p1 TRINITY_DN21794_c0_g1~~TRINITY_DN21794_c0_g1_i1.p1  ORF type:complete len:322 (+),score=52.06 TRINITY_DN21794_c0_g1_i1:65-967(+)
MLFRALRRPFACQVRRCSNSWEDIKPPLQIPPSIDQSAIVLGGSHVIGNVVLCPGSSVWYNCVVRADTNTIQIGPRSSISDGCVLQVSEQNGIHIEEDVTVGPRCVIIGSIIGSNTIIESSCTISEGCFIGSGCFIEAGAILHQETLIVDGWQVHQKYESGVKQQQRQLTEVEVDSFAKLVPDLKSIPADRNIPIVFGELVENCPDVDKLHLQRVYSLFATPLGLPCSLIRQFISDFEIGVLINRRPLVNVITSKTELEYHQLAAASALSLSQVHRVRIPDTSFVYSAQPPAEDDAPSKE